MIDPGQIMQIAGSMDAVAAQGAVLCRQGAAFAGTGNDVHQTWQQLRAYYTATPAPALLDASTLVHTTTAQVGADLSAIGTALVAYADEVRPIQRRLVELRAEAEAFVRSVAGDDDWRRDDSRVEQHNRLLHEVNVQVAAFMAAQRTCANAIYRRCGGTRIVADNADGTHRGNEFGFSAAVLDRVELDWGAPVGRDKPWWEDAVDQGVAYAKGIWVDGVWGTLKGLGGLVGVDGWSGLKESWGGLGRFALAITAPAMYLNQVTDLPGLPKGTLLNTLKETGKGLVAWDTWQQDPARAGGSVVFNVGSAVFGTKGSTSATKAATSVAAGVRVGELTGKVTKAVSSAGRLRAPGADLLQARAVAAALDERAVAQLRALLDPAQLPNVPGRPTLRGVLRDPDSYRVEVPSGLTRQEWMDELVTDPAQGAFDDHPRREERQVGLTLQERGDLPGPIRRDPTGDYEFIDALGRYWDVKTFHGEYWNGFDLARIERDMSIRLRLGEHRIMNTSFLSEAQIAALRQLIERRGWEEKVLWYP